MKNTLTRGFTLIELLVVIAIIGILASVVLASLSTARTNAAGAAFQSEVKAAQTNALVDCNGGATTFDIAAGTQMAGSTGNSCSDFLTGVDVPVSGITGATHNCGADITIDSATYTGSDCGG